MKIPTLIELLGVQTQFDADILKQEYPEWCELPQTDQRKINIVDKLKRDNRNELIGLLVFYCIVIIIIILTIYINIY